MALLTLLKQLEAQKCDFLSEVESWPVESISFRPSAEEWSVIEVLDHIVRVEVEILAATRRGMLKPHRIGVTDRLRTRFLQGVFRSDRKVKVPPKAALVLPGSDLELAAIVMRWSESRQELEEVLRSVPEAQLKQGIFRHSVAGWMGMAEILDFFSVHLVHHKYQLARLRSALRTYAPLQT